MAAPHPFVLFLHIQKTGGITVQRMLRSRYGPSLPKRVFTKLAKTSRSGMPLKDAAAHSRPSDHYFAGHFGHGIHRHLPEACTPYTYIALIREPFARIRSLYLFSREEPSAYYHGHARDKSFEQFVFDTGLMELDNGQTRQIAGDDQDLFLNRTPVGQIDQAVYDRACTHMDRDFASIGLIERFDESALLLAHALGWRDARYLRLNVTSKKSKEQFRVDDTLKQRILDHNAWDVKLYQRASAVLDEKIAAWDGDFAQDLADFKRDNAAYAKRWGPTYQRLTKVKTKIRVALGMPAGL